MAGRRLSNGVPIFQLRALSISDAASEKDGEKEEGASGMPWQKAPADSRLQKGRVP